jgi:hypothetical protein
MGTRWLLSMAACVALFCAPLIAGSLSAGTDQDPVNRLLFLDDCLSSLQFDRNGAESQDFSGLIPEPFDLSAEGLDQESSILTETIPSVTWISDPLEPRAVSPSIALLALLFGAGALFRVYASREYARWYRHFFGQPEQY